MSKVPVRVYIRVRPLLENEMVHSSEVCVCVEGEDQLVLGVDKAFRFDRVFPPTSTQAMVYEHAVEPLVRACVEGYNATVFAYGQTGSGKSFTMGSELEWRSEERKGVIPRALDGLFQLLPAETVSSVGVSYVEIYKDELRDLLVGVASERGGVTIREDSEGNTVVMGCTTVVVGSAEEALGWLEVGNSSRVTGATHMNHKSSRSHAVFTVHIQQKWVEADSDRGDPAIGDSSTLEHCLSAKFHFVDLAGSERVSKTRNQGERFKESVHINSGLLALGNVISALGGSKKRYPHIPYRDSKITRLLKDSLGGNARTVMITCLSPAAVNLTESLNSLKYAQRARNIENRPVVNRDPQSSQLLAMQAEIVSLREELVKAQSSHSLPPSTAHSSLTTQSSEMVSRVSELEQELNSAQQQCECYQTSLNQARDWLARLLSTATEGVCNVEETRKLLEWMENLPGGSEAPPTSHTPLSAKALQTIDLLRTELERCHADLQADEELFAEKLDEIADLQQSYSEVSAEKERLETMWLAAQESEESLRAELERVLGQLRNVEKELADRNRGSQRQGASSGEESLDNEQELPHKAGEIPIDGGNEGRDDYGEFLANRSLITERVSTSNLADFSEENVLRSLTTLTQILAANQRASEDLGKTWTRPQSSTQPHPQLSTQLHFQSSTKESQNKSQSSAKQNDSSSNTVKESVGEKRSKVTTRSSRLRTLKVQSSGSEETSCRPRTPVELSAEEPSFSRVGCSELCEAGEGVGSEGVRVVSEVDVLNESTVESRRQLTDAEEKLALAQDELRNLTLKIRLKEELIRELVKTGKATKQLNKSYLTKIQGLEREVLTVTKELGKTQAGLQRASQREVTPDVRRTLDEQKKKLALTEKKLASLQKKQKETQCLVQFGARRERRVDELEGEVERLRNQQEMLKRRLKSQADKKIRLESDLQKYQHRIEVLQTHSDQQSKVLRVKTEEAAVAQRRLRKMSGKRVTSKDPVTESSESVWLDEEVARILEQKQAIQRLERELVEREWVLEEREALIAKRDVLAFKQLQASQATARDILHLSLQIDSIESSLKRKEMTHHTPERGTQRKLQETETLTQERDELVRKCTDLQERMEDNNFLPDKEQRMLCELSEHIEILEAALDFKNQSIDSRQPGLKQVLHQDASSVLQIRSKLEQLSPPDLHNLLLRYVEKVVELQLLDRQNKQCQRELEMRITEQEREIGRLERSLKQSTAAGERQALALQKEHEQQVQLLVQQLADQQSSTHSSTHTQTLKDKIKLLEKDLYYYKKTSRDLRKKLRHEGSVSDSVALLSAQSVGSSAVSMLNTESGVKDSIETSVIAVEDSLSSVRAEIKGSGSKTNKKSIKGPESQTTESSHVVLQSGMSSTSEKSGVQAVKKPENEAREKPDSLTKGVASLMLEPGKASDSSDLDAGKASDGTARSKVVRKSKKQLRQLSASEIAERKSHKDRTVNT